MSVINYTMAADQPAAPKHNGPPRQLGCTQEHSNYRNGEPVQPYRSSSIHSMRECVHQGSCCMHGLAAFTTRCCCCCLEYSLNPAAVAHRLRPQSCKGQSSTVPATASSSYTLLVIHTHLQITAQWPCTAESLPAGAKAPTLMGALDTLQVLPWHRLQRLAGWVCAAATAFVDLTCSSIRSLTGHAESRCLGLTDFVAPSHTLLDHSLYKARHWRTH